MVMFILRIEEVWKHLTVVEIGRSYCISTYKAMVNIDADTVLISVVIGAVLLDPASV